MQDSRRNPLSPGERILKVATTLFSVHGFRGTSTRDVARRAKVNEVTVFRLFRNKEKLFIKVIEGRLNGSEGLSIVDSLNAAKNRDGALALMTDYMQQTFDPTFLRLLLFAVLEQPKLVKRYIQPRILDFYLALDGYLAQHARDGYLRPLEPDLAARALLGMVAYHRIFHELLGAGGSAAEEQPPLSKYMDIWLHGVLANEKSLEGKDLGVPV